MYGYGEGFFSDLIKHIIAKIKEMLKAFSKTIFGDEGKQASENITMSKNKCQEIKNIILNDLGPGNSMLTKEFNEKEAKKNIEIKEETMKYIKYFCQTNKVEEAKMVNYYKNLINNGITQEALDNNLLMVALSDGWVSGFKIYYNVDNQSNDVDNSKYENGMKSLKVLTDMMQFLVASCALIIMEEKNTQENNQPKEDQVVNKAPQEEKTQENPKPEGEQFIIRKIMKAFGEDDKVELSANSEFLSRYAIINDILNLLSNPQEITYEKLSPKESEIQEAGRDAIERLANYTNYSTGSKSLSEQDVKPLVQQSVAIGQYITKVNKALVVIGQNMESIFKEPVVENRSLDANYATGNRDKISTIFDIALKQTNFFTVTFNTIMKTSATLGGYTSKLGNTLDYLFKMNVAKQMQSQKVASNDEVKKDMKANTEKPTEQDAKNASTYQKEEEKPQDDKKQDEEALGKAEAMLLQIVGRAEEFQLDNAAKNNIMGIVKNLGTIQATLQRVSKIILDVVNYNNAKFTELNKVPSLKEFKEKGALNAQKLADSTPISEEQFKVANNLVADINKLLDNVEDTDEFRKNSILSATIFLIYNDKYLKNIKVKDNRYKELQKNYAELSKRYKEFKPENGKAWVTVGKSIKSDKNEFNKLQKIAGKGVDVNSYFDRAFSMLNIQV